MDLLKTYFNHNVDFRRVHDCFEHSQYQETKFMSPTQYCFLDRSQGPTVQAISSQGCVVRRRPCKSQARSQPLSSCLCLTVDSLRPRFGCIAGAEVLQADALQLSAGISCHDAASPFRFLMTVALTAEYQVTIVAVALLDPAGALYSTGNVTSGASSSHWGCPPSSATLCSHWCPRSW